MGGLAKKTIGVIQARMGSERLPGKILAPLGGRPLLAQLCARIRPARVDEWWLATSSEPADDVTEAWGFELGLRVFRGDPTDVLSRFLTIGREAGADWIVRVSAENPFLDAGLVDRLLDARDDSEEAKSADAIRLLTWRDYVSGIADQYEELAKELPFSVDPTAGQWVDGKLGVEVP